MATNIELRMDAVERRMTAIEERINELQKMLSKVATNREVTGLRVVLEDELKTIAAEVEANEADIDTIKQRLRLT